MIVAQLSDTHITSDRFDEAALRLQKAVDHILKLPVLPDVVFVTGDCVNNGQFAEYEIFKGLLRPLSMPIYVIPGNHDSRQQMLSLFPEQGDQALEGFIQFTVDTGDLRLIALDTHTVSRDEGNLCEKRLHWLDQRLAEQPNQPTIIFMHHPPVMMGLEIMDRMGLMDADAFLEVIGRHHQIERIVTGHVHMALTRRFAGSIVMSCPSTMHAMLPDIGNPKLVNVLMESPACLIHAWRETTGLVTYTSNICESASVKRLHDGERWLG